LGMPFERIVHIALPVYVLAGYFSAYRMARRTVEENPSTARPGRVTRWAAMSMLLIMPVAAFSACYQEWSASITLGELLGIMIGATMNIFFFFGGCIALLRKSPALPMGAE
jgi:hypothetical protein